MICIAVDKPVIARCPIGEVMDLCVYGSSVRLTTTSRLCAKSFANPALDRSAWRANPIDAIAALSNAAVLPSGVKHGFRDVRATKSHKMAGGSAVKIWSRNAL